MRRSSLDLGAEPSAGTAARIDAGLATAPSIGGDRAFPASFAQQRLWFLQQLEPAASVYKIEIARRLRGTLRLAALSRALEEILSRHEVLRTTFTVAEGQPVQVVHPQPSSRLMEVDLFGLPEPEREKEAARQIRLELETPFDLYVGPLVRARLFRLSEAEFIVFFLFHHIVFDGWSVDVFLRELSTLYGAYCAGEEESPLPGLPIQYADYALWQHEVMQGELLQSQLAFWRRHLGRDLPLLALPTDRPRPRVQTFQGAEESLTLPASQTRALEELARKENASFFMMMLAVFQTLLFRYTAQEVILVGTPVAGRSQVETEGLVGFFVNTLVLRGDLSGDPPFRRFLRNTRETALAAYSNQDLPFEKLVEALNPSRSLGQTPLFQVMLSVQDAVAESLRLPGVVVTPFSCPATSAMFDIGIHAVRAASGVEWRLNYNTDLFHAATARRILSHLRVMCEGIVADPDRPISRLPLLTTEERRQVLVEWNRTEAECPAEKCVHELFEERATIAPDAVAVRFAGEELTYGELEQRANQLARHLRGLGVGPESLVGVCLERSLELSVALLGVLKAGGAYLPLDPAYPEERLRFMLEDSRAEIVLTQDRLVGNLPQARRLISMDQDWSSIAREGEQTPESGVTPENLAYVMYTSGSTGRPKGVMIPHRALVNETWAWARLCGYGTGDRVLQFASVSFDTSAEELFPAWAAGATVVIRPEEIGSDLNRFADFISREGITVLSLPTAFWHEWVLQLSESSWPLPRQLRLVILGGEAVAPDRFTLWRQLVGSYPRWINGYGPTETTITATVWEPSADEHAETQVVPIGRPMANVHIYLLDSGRQLVPVGVPGEIYIGGAGVARGYLNHPKLTAERFVLQDLGRGTERLYRTGDLGRYLPEGDVQFLGRIDHQVKIRGFRIELGEIETTLARHPAVRESVVLAREDGMREKRLVAYFVPAGRAPSSRELREFLSRSLPDHMLPSVFVALEQMPVTESGKINRRALPEPSPVQDAVSSTPRDPLELQLTRVWEDLLSRRPIGVWENFFDLGGHSLLAVRLFTRIEKLSGRALPLTTLFEAPTIGQLAEVLRRQGWSDPWSALVPIQPAGSKPPLFCVHAGGGYVLFYRALSRRLGPDQPLYGLQAVGLDGKQPRHTTVEQMAEHYIREMRSLQPQGPYFIAGASFGGLIAYEMARQLHEGGERAALVGLFDTHGPGYPRYLPGTASWRLRLDRSIQRARHHLGSIALLEPKERPVYVRQKARKALQQWRMKARKRAEGLRRALFEKFGRPIPPALRKVQSNFAQAQRQYAPAPYPGCVTLFRATQQPSGIYPDPSLGWGELALGGLEIREIPGIHGAMVAEPRVRFLAEELRSCLARAVSTSEARQRTAAAAAAGGGTTATG